MEYLPPPPHTHMDTAIICQQKSTDRLLFLLDCRFWPPGLVDFRPSADIFAPMVDKMDGMDLLLRNVNLPLFCCAMCYADVSCVMYTSHYAEVRGSPCLFYNKTNGFDVLLEFHLGIYMNVRPPPTDTG